MFSAKVAMGYTSDLSQVLLLYGFVFLLYFALNFGISLIVRAYQRLAGLTVDGVVGRATWENLYAQANRLRLSGPVVSVKRLPYPGAPLEVGASGQAVLYYTVLLARIAYYYDTVRSPGILPDYTEDVAAGTRGLQQLVGLPVTGVVDADTWDAAEGLGIALLTGTLEPGAAPLPQPEEG